MSTTTIASWPFCPASRRQLLAKNAKIALAVFSTASPTTARSLIWRPKLAALRRKPRNQAMLCDVDVEPDSDEVADLRMETLVSTFADDSAANRAKCLQVFLAKRVSSVSQHISPYLEDHPELRKRDFVDPYP